MLGGGGWVIEDRLKRALGQFRGALVHVFGEALGLLWVARHHLARFRTGDIDLPADEADRDGRRAPRHAGRGNLRVVETDELRLLRLAGGEARPDIGREAIVHVVAQQRPEARRVALGERVDDEAVGEIGRAHV